MCHCWVNEEADGKKRQELKELFVPDIIKFLFNRLPRTAILTEFQKLQEQNVARSHLRTQRNLYVLYHQKKKLFFVYVLFTRLPLTHQRGIEMENDYQLKLFAQTVTQLLLIKTKACNMSSPSFRFHTNPFSSQAKFVLLTNSHSSFQLATSCD